MVETGTLRHTSRSAAGSGTTCYYFEVWAGGVLIGTHGNSGSPVSCNSTTAYATDTVSLPEINSAARANAVTIRLFVRNSAGAQSEHATASLGVTYYLANP